MTSLHDAQHAGWFFDACVAEISLEDALSFFEENCDRDIVGSSAYDYRGAAEFWKEVAEEIKRRLM